MAIPAGFNPPDNADTDPIYELVLKPGPNMPEHTDILIGRGNRCIPVRVGENFKVPLSQARELKKQYRTLEYVGAEPPPEKEEASGDSRLEYPEDFEKPKKSEDKPATKGFRRKSG